MEKFQHIIGKPLPQAMAEVMLMGFDLRVIRQDGESFITTAEYNGKRVDVEVEKGIVVKILTLS